MHIIQLKNSRYQARKRGGEWQFSHDGKWLGNEDFIQALIDDQKWEEVVLLAELRKRKTARI